MRHRTVYRGRDGRGMVLLVVLVILGALVLAGALLVSMGTMDVRMSSEFARTTRAFYAAEAGVARALDEIEHNSEWTEGSGSLGNDTAYSVSVETVSEAVRRIVSEGSYGDSRRKVALKIVLDDLDGHPLIAAGDLYLRGMGSLSTEGARIGGDAYLELDTGFPAFSLYRPGASGVYVTGETGAVTLLSAPAIDAPAMRLMRGDWSDIIENADPSHYYDSDGQFLTGDASRTFSNLNFSAVSEGDDGRRTVVVDGDVTLRGTLSGDGQLIASGEVNFDEDARPSGTVAVTAGGDVRVALSDDVTSPVTLYIYSEGDVVVSGGAAFTGMIVALGNITIESPDGFVAAMSASEWDRLAGVHSILVQPFRSLSWEETYR